MQNPQYAVIEPNSHVVHAIITEPFLEFYQKNFPIFDIKEISNIGSGSTQLLIETQKVNVSCYFIRLKESSTHYYMITTCTAENVSYKQIVKALSE